MERGNFCTKTPQKRQFFDCELMGEMDNVVVVEMTLHAEINQKCYHFLEFSVYQDFLTSRKPLVRFVTWSPQVSSFGKDQMEYTNPLITQNWEFQHRDELF